MAVRIVIISLMAHINLIFKSKTLQIIPHKKIIVYK